MNFHQNVGGKNCYISISILFTCCFFLVYVNNIISKRFIHSLNKCHIFILVFLCCLFYLYFVFVKNNLVLVLLIVIDLV